MISQARTKTGGFKTWMRVVALVLVVVFVPQQVAWAVDYDWRSIWRNSQPQAAGSSSAALAALPYSAIKSAGFEKQIAFNIKESLDSLRRSGSLSIQFNNNIVVGRTIQKPITKDNVENIYRKLVDSRNNIITCGAYSLYNLLGAYGMLTNEYRESSIENREVTIIDIANTLILIDLLSSKDLEPTFNKNQLEISFYSLIKAAEVYGLRLQPFHFSTFQTDLESVNKQISFPFIATIDEPHTVLVKSIDENGVLIVDNDVERMISLDEFKQRFMGYCLAVDVVKEKGIEPVSNEFAKSIKIKGRSRKNELPTFNEVYGEFDTADTLIAVGMMFLSAIPAGKSSNSDFGQRFAQNIYSSNVAQAAMNLAIDAGMKPANAQIIGYMVQGGVNAKLSGSTFTPGALKGAATGYFSTVAYRALKHTELFTNSNLRPIGQSVVSILGSSAAYITFSVGNNLLNGKSLGTSIADVFRTRTIKVENNDTLDSIIKNNNISAAQLQALNPTINLSNLNNMVGQTLLVSGDWTQFRGYLISQSIGTSFEYIAAKNGINPDYARILSAPIETYISGGKTRDQIWSGILKGAASVALTAIGGDYNDTTGKNKWGLTATQMHALTYTGFTLVQGGLSAAGVTADNFMPKGYPEDLKQRKDAGDMEAARQYEFATQRGFLNGVMSNLYSLRNNIDMGEYGNGGWNDFQALEKQAQFNGIANFYSNADYMISQAKQQGNYTSWKQFVKDGYVSSLFPSLAYSITQYMSSALHTTNTNLLASAAGSLLSLIPTPHITRQSRINRDLAKMMNQQEAGQWQPTPDLLSSPDLKEYSIFGDAILDVIDSNGKYDSSKIYPITNNGETKYYVWRGKDGSEPWKILPSAGNEAGESAPIVPQSIVPGKVAQTQIPNNIEQAIAPAITNTATDDYLEAGEIKPLVDYFTSN
ncbi:MAG: cysteine peptidase family C39 domain-containing protein, partial [Candidatus Omnitrophica bacterium]|nr:cysteine peptidase family C39 domain-containing protein [Candidatus Omnitrophota bacterium]